MLTAGYTDAGQRYLVIATTVHTDGALGAADPIAAQGELRRLIARLPDGCAVLLDLYVIAGEAPDADPERSAEKIRALLGRLPERLERVAVAVRRPKGDERSAWFTFRRASDERAPARGRWRTARCAGCTRWSPTGSGCGGCAGSS